MKRKNEFDEKLIEAVNGVLKETFGESGQLIYAYLKSQSLMPEEIPEKPEVFANCLENFSSGGSVVEAMILRNLYSSFGFEFKQTNDGYSFADHVTELRKAFQR